VIALRRIRFMGFLFSLEFPHLSVARPFRFDANRKFAISMAGTPCISRIRAILMEQMA
jgi:hypothetical protein